MVSMRRGFALGLGWVAVTAAAVLVAWRGVDVVADQLTESRPSSLSSAAVASALTDDGTGGKTSASTSTTVRRSTTSLRPGTTAPPTSGPPPTATPRTTAPPPTAATTTAPPPAAETRTYSLVGGTVGIRYENGGARLLYANPNSGFTVKIGDAGPPRVEAEFESDTHRSRIDARWDDGPHVDIDEDGGGAGDDDGGGGGGSGPG